MKRAYKLVESLDIGQIRNAIIHNLKGLDRLKFPEDAIKFDVRAILSHIKKRRGLDRAYKGRWVDFPSRGTPTSREERHERIKDLFNDVGDYAIRLGDPKYVLPFRRWTVQRTAERTGQPYLALTSDENAERVGWGNVLSVAEYEFGPVIASKNAAIKRLAQRAQSIFEHQQDRSYVLCVAVCNDDMAMVVFNRGGVCTSDWFNIHTSPTRFIRSLVGLMSVERAFLGFDPNMDFTQVGGRPTNTVTINGNVYRLEGLITYDDNVRGRATSCWRISRDGKTYVLKDYWFKLDSSGEANEVKILRIIRGIEGVPELIDYDVCKDVGGGRHYNTRVDLEDLDAKKSLTKGQREKFENWDVFYRVRVVTTPYATRIREFTSRRELIYALITIVDAMEKLHERDVLHHDISRYNIMLGTKTNEFGERGGLLIDYDHANHPSDRYQESPCLIGTLRFMARDYLHEWRRTPRIHKYYHDLESLFYVICYIFTTSAGPNGVFREDMNSVIKKLIVGKWSGFVNDSLEYMGSWKVSRCESERLFESVIDEFTEYFKEDALRKCMRDLRELVFDEGYTNIPEPGGIQELRGEDGEIDVKYLQMDDREPKEYFHAFKRILREAYDNLEETKSMARQKELNKNTRDGQEHVLPECVIVAGPQGSQIDGGAPEDGVAADVEAPEISADVEMGDASRPVSKLANPSSSASNPNHENETIPDPNASKKRKRSSNTQEGEPESPPPKRAASDKENVNDENVSDSKFDANGAKKPPLSRIGRLKRHEHPREPERAQDK